jgi:uncharacterized protein
MTSLAQEHAPAVTRHPSESAPRLYALDLLRGFALAGMFVVHFHQRSTEGGALDDTVRVLVWRLAESKSHGTFALLFGAGFAIQLLRSEQAGRPFTGRYLRRLTILAMFGFAAHALFGFNVLLGYAVWGLPLLLMRSWSTRALLLAAILSASSVSLYTSAVPAYLAHARGPKEAARIAEADRSRAAAVNGALSDAEEGGDYTAVLAARRRHMAWFYTQPFFVMPGATLALFIAGLLLLRHGVFEDPLAHPRILTGMTVLGVGAWAADNWLPAEVNSLGLVRDQWLTFAYVSLALIVLARWPRIAAALQPVATAGRMALTNYLLQIATLDLLFSGYALGLGDIRPLFGLGAALACFGAEVALSTFWLARFRFGPAEWLWRSLTSGQRQRLRVEDATAA